MLVSANAMWRGDHFSVPRSVLDLGDVALDSAGFVAMFCYGGYRWTVDQYVGLAGVRPWAWWAAMDFCCEPEIAADRDEVARRVTLTVETLARCRDAAARAGVPAPMPVLQGRLPADYVRCADAMPDLPALVGVGSVCRRQLGGPDGLMEIVRVLDAALPRATALHLFGVKGTAIAALSGHPRVASVDSMAWDFAARIEKHKNGVSGSPLAYREGYLTRWYERQNDRAGLFGWRAS